MISTCVTMILLARQRALQAGENPEDKVEGAEAENNNALAGKA